jgi:hypothetical protein
MEPIFGKYALRYAAQGFEVFPLAPNSKKPFRESHGLSQATNDTKVVGYWATLYPYSNIGLRTGEASKVSVVDIDPKNFGFETEGGFRNEGKIWPETPVSHTRSGGRHIWLAYHPALVTGSNRLGAGIDIRGDGGYVVGAGSVVEGRKYSWLKWFDGYFAPVPQWVLDYLEADRIAREAALAEKAKNIVRVDTSKLSAVHCRRYEGLAASSVDRLCNRLRVTRKPGRGRELFTCCCFMAPYIRRGFIQEAVVRRAFEDACKRNGLVAENGIIDVRKTMTGAFAKSTDGFPISQSSKIGHIRGRHEKALHLHRGPPIA